jgi:hypothetical protein
MTIRRADGITGSWLGRRPFERAFSLFDNRVDAIHLITFIGPLSIQTIIHLLSRELSR